MSSQTLAAGSNRSTSPSCFSGGMVYFYMKASVQRRSSKKEGEYSAC